MVLNAESERETLAMVSFDAKQRHIGVLAAGKVRSQAAACGLVGRGGGRKAHHPRLH